MEICDDVKTAVKLQERRSEWFNVNVEVHQGSIFSPHLFAVALDEIAKNVGEGILKELLYTDNLILLGDTGKK